MLLNRKYIMVRPDISPTQTPAGLTIPESAMKPTCTGIILKAPDGEEDLVGEGCMFKPNSGIPFEFNGEDVLFIHAEDELLALGSDEAETETS